jgi:holo-[acyl-carrier protein] synthase
VTGRGIVAAGIGIDLVAPERLRDAASRWGAPLLDRLFTPEERAFCDALADPWPHYAARFAAKEALGKALGTGLRGIGWKDIAVERDAAGRPRLRVAWPEGIAAREVLVSLTHERGMAGAVVLLGPAETASSGGSAC